MTGKELAKAMITYRAEHDMSVKELAYRARVTPQTIRMIERGQAHPTRLTVAKIKMAIYWKD